MRHTILRLLAAVILAGCGTQGVQTNQPPPAQATPSGPRTGFWSKQIDNNTSVSFEVSYGGLGYYVDFFQVHYSGVCVIYSGGITTPYDASGDYFVCDGAQVIGMQMTCGNASILFTDDNDPYGLGWGRAVVTITTPPTICSPPALGPSPQLPKLDSAFEVLY